MAKFRESNITDSGLDYARKAANGVIKITFTKAVLSADQHQNDSLQTLQGLTSLNGFVQSDSINYATQASDSNVVLPLRFHNTGMTSDSYINTVGLYASDGNNEVLYSIIVNDDPDLFPAYNGTTPESIKINYETQVGRADQVNVEVSPIGMVTEEEFQPVKAEVDRFHINDSYSAGNDMYAMPNGIWKLNNGDMINTPFGDHTTIVGTVINYGNYTTYVDKNGATYVTSPESQGWQQYATMQSVANGFEYHGEWSGSLAEFRHTESGIYQLNPDNKDAQGALQGWDGYGTAVVYHNGVDTYVTIYGHNNLIWNNHTVNDTFGKWIPQPTADDINNLKDGLNNAFQNRGDYSGDLLKTNDLQDGYYNISNNQTNAPNDFDGYGYLNKKTVGTDVYIELHDNGNGKWTNHYGQWGWLGWSGSSNANNITSQVASVAIHEASDVSSLSSGVASNATNINSTFQNRGNYTGNLLDVRPLLDGYYNIFNNQNNAPEGFDGYGYFVKKTVGPDLYVELYDNANHHWTNHYGNAHWDGWMQVPDTDEVNNAINSLASLAASAANNASTLASMSALSTSISNNATSIAANSAALNSKVSFSGGTITTGNGTFVPMAVDEGHSLASSNAASINNVFQNRGDYSGDLLKSNDLQDGYYNISNNQTNAPNDFDGYGYLNKKTVGTDVYIELHDNGNGKWTNHYGQWGWLGWSGSSNANNITSQVASAASHEAGDVSSLSAGISSNATSINNVFQNRGNYTGDLLNVGELLDGYYNVYTDTNNAPEGFDGYGYFEKKTVGTDLYVELYDNGNHHWTNHYGNSHWDGWMQVPDTNEVNNAINSLASLASSAANNASTLASMSALSMGISNNATSISNNTTAISNNATSIAANSAALNSKVSFSGGTITTGNGTFVPAAIGDAQSLASSNANSINSLSNNAMVTRDNNYQGNWQDLLNGNHAPGWYYGGGNSNGAPNGYSGYGAMLVWNATDGFGIMVDNGGQTWSGHRASWGFTGWKKLDVQDDVVALQNQVNGVLARQSLILNQGIPVPFNGNLDPNARYYDNGRVVKITETFTINNNQSVTIDVSRLGVSFSTVSTDIAASAAVMFTVGISNNIVTITLSNPQANTVSQTFNNMEIYLN